MIDAMDHQLRTGLIDDPIWSLEEKPNRLGRYIRTCASQGGKVRQQSKCIEELCLRGGRCAGAELIRKIDFNLFEIEESCRKNLDLHAARDARRCSNSPLAS